MLRKMTLVAALSAGVAVAAPAKGSRIGKGITDYLPNLAETNFVISMANVYMQAASLVRSVNASVNAMNRATEQLQMTKQVAEEMWGNVQALQNVNIYDMDSWAAGLSSMRYDIIGEGLMQMNSLLASSAINFADGTLGGYIKVQNGLSYDAREAGVAHAFKAYYYQEDWGEYKSTHGLEQQNEMVQNKLQESDALREQREALRNWTCPQGTSETDCRTMLNANAVKVREIDAQMDGISEDIDKITQTVAVGQLKRNATFMQLDYLEEALKKVHLSADDYAKAYDQINTASANLARKAQRFITGRLTSSKRDPQPRPSSDMEGPSVAELCARPENIVSKPDGSSFCIYSEDDRNRTAAPKEEWDRSDLEKLEPDNEGPRDVSLSDFQKLKAEWSYIKLMQEQLLFDMEMDQAYLTLAMLSRKTAKAMDHRPRLRAVREGLGLAAVVGDANSFTASTIRIRHNRNFKAGKPWDMSKTLEENLAE